MGIQKEDARLDLAVEKAECDFWATIAREYPEIKSGDCDPMIAVRLMVTMKSTVKHWLEVNK